jgi:predicted Fe-S protein YdhL (DUF1289 family)
LTRKCFSLTEKCFRWPESVFHWLTFLMANKHRKVWKMIFQKVNFRKQTWPKKEKEEHEKSKVNITLLHSEQSSRRQNTGNKDFGDASKYYIDALNLLRESKEICKLDRFVLYWTLPYTWTWAGIILTVIVNVRRNHHFDRLYYTKGN